MNLLYSFWTLTAEMAPYLILGFFIAGLLHVFLPKDWVLTWLSKGRFRSVLVAALMGVPLPLCSCGVIPVADQLHRDGANKGATLSFLASTPSTGVDSIFSTWAMLGLPFTLIRTIHAFLAGLFIGFSTEVLLKTPKAIPTQESITFTKTKFNTQSIYLAIDYAINDLLKDAKKWLLIGFGSGALITTFLPAELFSSTSSSLLFSYLAMLAFGLPLYVCATGSIPIAAALLEKGLSPGAALIFLIVGPATNTATLAFVGQKLGKKELLIYLSTLSLSAIFAGLLIDWQIIPGFSTSALHLHNETITWWKHLFAALLLISIAKHYIPKRKAPLTKGKNMKIKNPTMTCSGCSSNIEKKTKEAS